MSTTPPYRPNQPPKIRRFGRGGGIRTPDPLLPKQMRYQTALRPDSMPHSNRVTQPAHSPRPLHNLCLLLSPHQPSRCFTPTTTNPASTNGTIINPTSTTQTPPKNSQLLAECFSGSLTDPVSSL